MDEKKLLWAVVLSGLVVVVFGVVVPMVTGKFGKDKDEQKAQKTAPVKKQEEPQEQVPVDEGPSMGEIPGPEDDEFEAVDASLALGPGETLDIQTDLYQATISPRGGVIRSLKLLKDRYVEEKDDGSLVPIDIVTRSPSGYPLVHLTFKARWEGGELPQDLEYEVSKHWDGGTVLEARTRSWQVQRTYQATDDDYQIQAVTRMKNLTDDTITVNPRLTVRMFREEGKSSGLLGFLRPVRQKVEGQCMLDGDLERKDLKKIIKKGGFDRMGMVNWLSVDDLYFMAALIPQMDRLDAQAPSEEGHPVRCVVDTDGRGGIRGTLDFGRFHVQPGETIELPARTYLGPKEYDILDEAGHDLGKVIDYGWFSSLSRFLYVVLVTFVGWVGNWALAIIMLTIAVKLVLMPLTHWSFKSMQKMQAIKPLIDDLNRQYPEPEDREKKSQALMNLYRTHKINPLMGCLPMLLQLPIWIALYRMLSSSVELYRTPLILWIHDLSQPDPYFVLPLILGASMFAQQKLTPTTADSQQAKMMMYMMPIMFTVFMLFLPAGLNLYILVNTVLTIAQQRLMYRPKVVTTEKASVQLMSDMDPEEIQAKRKGTEKATKKRGKGRRKK